MLADLANEPWVLYPPDSFFGSLVVEALRASGHEPPRATATSLSFNMQMEILATGRFLAVLPGFLLGIPGRNPPLKGLPVALRSAKMPVGTITLKNRTLTPLAQLFIDNLRTLAKGLAKS